MKVFDVIASTPSSIWLSWKLMIVLLHITRLLFHSKVNESKNGSKNARLTKNINGIFVNFLQKHICTLKQILNMSVERLDYKRYLIIANQYFW